MNQNELLQRAERYFPGACLGMMPLPPDLQMVMVRGEGAKVYDAAGKEYLDYMLGSGPLLLGHARPEVVAAAQQDVLVAPFNDAAATATLIEQHHADLAAVIVEPLQRALKPEPGFLETLRSLTQRHGIVLIFDEIVTGFRLAWGGAQEHYGV